MSIHLLADLAKFAPPFIFTFFFLYEPCSDNKKRIKARIIQFGAFNRMLYSYIHFSDLVIII